MVGHQALELFARILAALVAVVQQAVRPASPPRALPPAKTEAAFLPLLSRLVESERTADGFAVLYVSPLKALINDQHRRLESLCKACVLISAES